MNVSCNKTGTNRVFIDDRYYISFVSYSGLLQLLVLRDKFNNDEKLLDINFQTGLNAKYFKDKIEIYKDSQITREFLQFITMKLGNNFKIVSI